MTDVDIFGDILDADTVEGYVRATLQAWMPAHLAHQERRRDLDAMTLPQPRSWPTISEFDATNSDQLPAIFILSAGSGVPTHDRGVYATPFRFEIAVVIAGKNETEARFLASVYLAAIKGALIQNRTLGGNVEKCVWTGNDDHAFGRTERGEQRAIYGTNFEVTVRDAVDARLGPLEPPEDPYDPGSAPENPNEAEILVTATKPEDTP